MTTYLRNVTIRIPTITLLTALSNTTLPHKGVKEEGWETVSQEGLGSKDGVEVVLGKGEEEVTDTQKAVQEHGTKVHDGKRGASELKEEEEKEVVEGKEEVPGNRDAGEGVNIEIPLHDDQPAHEGDTDAEEDVEADTTLSNDKLFPRGDTEWQKADRENANAALQLAIDNLRFIQHTLRHPDLLDALVRRPEGVSRVLQNAMPSADHALGVQEDQGDSSDYAQTNPWSASWEPDVRVGVPTKTIEVLAMDLLENHPEAGEIAQKMFDACVIAMTAALADQGGVREDTDLQSRVRNVEGVLDVTLGRLHALELKGRGGGDNGYDNE